MTWSESNPNVGTLLSTFFLEPDEVFLLSVLVSKPESMFFGGILDNGARVLPDTAGVLDIFLKIVWAKKPE